MSASAAWRRLLADLPQLSTLLGPETDRAHDRAVSALGEYEVDADFLDASPERSFRAVLFALLAAQSPGSGFAAARDRLLIRDLTHLILLDASPKAAAAEAEDRARVHIPDPHPAEVTQICQSLLDEDLTPRLAAALQGESTARVRTSMGLQTPARPFEVEVLRIADNSKASAAEVPDPATEKLLGNRRQLEATIGPRAAAWVDVAATGVTLRVPQAMAIALLEGQHVPDLLRAYARTQSQLTDPKVVPWLNLFTDAQVDYYSGVVPARPQALGALEDLETVTGRNLLADYPPGRNWSPTDLMLDLARSYGTRAALEFATLALYDPIMSPRHRQVVQRLGGIDAFLERLAQQEVLLGRGAAMAERIQNYAARERAAAKGNLGALAERVAARTTDKRWIVDALAAEVMVDGLAGADLPGERRIAALDPAPSVAMLRRNLGLTRQHSAEVQTLRSAVRELRTRPVPVQKARHIETVRARPEYFGDHRR